MTDFVQDSYCVMLNSSAVRRACIFHYIVIVVSYLLTQNRKMVAHIFSTMHAVAMSLFSMYILYYSVQPNEIANIIPFSITYFATDAILWTMIIGDTKKNNIFTIAHHGSALFFLYSMHCYNIHLVHPFVTTYIMFTEISTPFINFHQIFKYYPVSNYTMYLNKLIIFLIFLVVRVVGLFCVIAIAFTTDVVDIYLIGSIIFLILNSYWFAKICGMAKKKVEKQIL